MKTIKATPVAVEQKQKQKSITFPCLGKHNNYDIYILDEITSGKYEYYVIYYLKQQHTDHIRKELVEIIDPNIITKNSNEIYSWDVFPNEDRLKLENLEEYEDYEDLPESKTELIELLMKYHTALNRAEEIIKRNRKIEEEVSDPNSEIKDINKTSLEDFRNMIREIRYKDE